MQCNSNNKTLFNNLKMNIKLTEQRYEVLYNKTIFNTCENDIKKTWPLINDTINT